MLEASDMTDNARLPKPGFCYVLTHPAWTSIGIVKCGSTSRHPSKRLAEITSSSGLIAPGRVHFSIAVGDMRAVEAEVKRLLAAKRVRKRRELFRVTPEEAQRAVQRAAETVGTASAVWSQAPRRPRPARRSPTFRAKRRWPGDAARAAVAVGGLVALALLAGVR
jgi:T5orf172 domain-containing protein